MTIEQMTSQHSKIVDTIFNAQFISKKTKIYFIILKLFYLFVVNTK
jgi:hypothetical protein